MQRVAHWRERIAKVVRQYCKKLVLAAIRFPERTLDSTQLGDVLGTTDHALEPPAVVAHHESAIEQGDPMAELVAYSILEFGAGLAQSRGVVLVAAHPRPLLRTHESVPPFHRRRDVFRLVAEQLGHAAGAKNGARTDVMLVNDAVDRL